jgi:predicted 3-demethylubiquinone-9 3-methyltransferase (glyoxalase superfamily)
MPLNPSTLTACLWFDSEAEAAMNFYVGLLPNSKLGKITRFAADAPGGKKAGDVMVVTATLMGTEFVGLNGGPMFHFDEAISFQIPCQTQAEIDRYWDAFSADGGKPGPCGWIKDKFGLSWQVTPVMLTDLLENGSPEVALRVTQAFMQMGKLDIAAIEAAAKGS